MTAFGYTMMCEQSGPRSLVEDLIKAEQAGFDFAPDLVNAALAIVDASADQATLIGDSPWDAHSARQAGVETIGVLTGGFSIAELRDAGAIEVYESIAELRARLHRTVLSGSWKSAHQPAR